MPYGDRTGPRGQGPRTGRSMGFCSGYEVAGYANRGGNFHGGRRAYMNGGGGWGHRHRFYATGHPGWMRDAGSYVPPYRATPFAAPVSSRQDEMELLRDEAAYFEEVLAEVRDRILKLETVPEADESQTGG